MKEYNVILKKDVDYDGFWEDMETETDGLLYIPNRRIEFTNERPGSLRQCWYLLTDEEAEIVKQDSRVLSVEIPPDHRDDIQIELRKIQEGIFTKTTSDSGNYQNWGLIRSSHPNNVYGTGTTTDLDYEYDLDGTGVDIVIQDSGIQIDHPEFQDENGVSRFVSVDWGSYGSDTTGSFTQSPNHDRDYDGHGTHCAGIAAGKTFGWAKNSKIHHQKIAGLEGIDDDGTGISVTHAFDSIKLWHTAKTADPKTGFKRPTVVNMSWGYVITYSAVSAIYYRGTSYTGTSIDSTTERQNFGLYPYTPDGNPPYSTNPRIVDVDTDIEELLDMGVHVCVAAGNRSHKISDINDLDWNNSASLSGGNSSAYSSEYPSGYVTYNRGSSPYGDAENNGGPRAIIVGSVDSLVTSSIQDQKATYSETGPGVDIYAPGTDIMSACSTTNRFSAPSYYANGSFKQTNISGTSMASPQVAGVCALILQRHPTWTPAQVKQWLLDNAGTALYDTGVGNDWTNNRSLKGGDVKFLFSKKESLVKRILVSGNLSLNIPIQYIK
jgi:subtilisin family serine protease